MQLADVSQSLQPIDPRSKALVGKQQYLGLSAPVSKISLSASVESVIGQRAYAHTAAHRTAPSHSLYSSRFSLRPHPPPRIATTTAPPLPRLVSGESSSGYPHLLSERRRRRDDVGASSIRCCGCFWPSASSGTSKTAAMRAHTQRASERESARERERAGERARERERAGEREGERGRERESARARERNVASQIGEHIL